MSLSRSTGKFKLVENGKVTAEKFSDEIVQYMKKISIKVHVTPFLSLFLVSYRVSHDLERAEIIDVNYLSYF